VALNLPSYHPWQWAVLGPNYTTFQYQADQFLWRTKCKTCIMQPIVINDLVAGCLSVTWLHCAKMAEWIEALFGEETLGKHHIRQGS